MQTPANQTRQPRTDFNWGVYADATLAGLSTLIPVPLFDMLFEDFFMRRMPGDIARSRGERLDPEIIALLNQSNEGCVEGCLLMPFKLVYELIKRISKKLLYFLTVKDATDRVSFYWHRAFLIDYALLLDHLDSPQSASCARSAMDLVLQTTQVSPLLQVAQQIVSNSRNIFRSLRRARRGKTDASLEQKRGQIAEHWGDFAGYLRLLASRYDQAYSLALENCPDRTQPTGEETHD